MFSPRLVAVCGLALLAAVTAHPAPEKSVSAQPITSMSDDDFGFPWMSISPFSLFAPLWKLIPSFADIGPRIYSDDDQFQVVVNVKDYRKEDLKVKVKGDLIFVQGAQEANHNNRDVFATQFFHTYSLPSNSSSAAVTAKLTTDGFLVVTAPISEDIDDSKDTVREDIDVPIVETGAPYRREVRVKPVAAPTTTEAVITTQTPSTTELTTTEVPKTTQEPTTVQVTTTTPAPMEAEEPTTSSAPITNSPSTTTQAPTTSQEPTTTQGPTNTEAPATTQGPTTTEAPATEPSPTPTVSPIAVEDEEVKEPETPIEPEDATEKDNAIPHGNEDTP